MAIRRIVYKGDKFQTVCLNCRNRDLPKRRKDGATKYRECGTVILYRFTGNKVIMTDKKAAHLFADYKKDGRGRKKKDADIGSDGGLSV